MKAHEHSTIYTADGLKQHIRECDDIPWLRRQVLERLSENLRIIDQTISKSSLQVMFDKSALEGHPSNGSAALHNQLRALLKGEIA